VLEDEGSLGPEAPGCEDLDVCRQSKLVCVAAPSSCTTLFCPLLVCTYDGAGYPAGAHATTRRRAADGPRGHAAGDPSSDRGG